MSHPAAEVTPPPERFNYADYLLGLKDYAELVKREDARLLAGLPQDARDKPFLDFRRWPLAGATAPEKHLLRIRLKGKYPQWNYWMALAFTAPIPWEADLPGYGFNSTGASWLPQPADWAPYARDSQAGVPGSTLELYRSALKLRREHDLGNGEVQWIEGYGTDVVAFRTADITVIANLGDVAVELPVGDVLLASETITGGALPSDTTVWLRA